jgi:hypothetical protein
MPFDGTQSPRFEPLGKIDEVIDLLGSPVKWCKGSERNRAGQYCIRGAMIAVGALEMLEPAVLGAIHQVAGRGFRRIEEFNDYPRTTHAQVLKVLNRARDNIAGGNLAPAAPVRGAHPRVVFEEWVSSVWEKCFG